MQHYLVLNLSTNPPEADVLTDCESPEAAFMGYFANDPREISPDEVEAGEKPDVVVYALRGSELTFAEEFAIGLHQG